MNDEPRTVRVMWLLNHATARRAEVNQLQAVGITEVYVPKSFPVDESNLSGNVSYDLDKNLTIPAEDLTILNAANWYEDPGPEAWAVANQYFSIAFFAFFPRQVDNVIRNFKGTCILRVFGLAGGASYSDQIYARLGVATVMRIKNMGNRFWFGEAYSHLHEVEQKFLQRRTCYLPLTLPENRSQSKWEGGDAQILFVCPRIGSSQYYERLYDEFVEMAGTLPYKVGGAQAIKVPDRNILGFVPREQHDANMRRFGAMFYHNSGPNHIHYHPLEAIQVGMPLVFMAGSLLDKLGGKDQPGRSQTSTDAHNKLKRILDGDRHLIDDIRTNQARLLDTMLPRNCDIAWKQAFKKITETPDAAESAIRQKHSSKIAVILPIGYRGGTLRAAKMIAQAIYQGSRTASEPADIVFAHIDDPAIYSDEMFDDLHPNIRRRSLRWTILDNESANRAMRFAGHEIKLTQDRFLVPADGINNFLDCDLWVIVSDRIDLPLLPLRPYAVIAYDYIQRYQRLLPGGLDQPYLDLSRNAAGVLVTTKFTYDDAIQYAGIESEKLHLVPMMWPGVPTIAGSAERDRRYFVWPTNPSIHKNHLNAVKALRIYYDDLDGSLQCRITGVASRSLFTGDSEHFKELRDMLSSSRKTKRRVKIMGELSDTMYFSELHDARFLWHPALIDNGTFCVVEAAALNVPSLSSDYPAMREMDLNFELNMTWCDAMSPRQMAERLKFMESNADALRSALPAHETLNVRGVDRSAAAYWMAVRSCL